MNMNFSTRAAPVTIDEKNFTVTVMAASEKPVMTYSYEYGTINEVLLMSGFHAPDNGQVPLLDSHSRGSVKAIIGKADNFKIVDGQYKGLDAFVTYSMSEEGMSAFGKVKEGISTDFSVGFVPNFRRYIPENETAVIEGKTYSGPLLVVTDWNLFELSQTPIGADDLAKARSLDAEKAIGEKLETLGKSLAEVHRMLSDMVALGRNVNEKIETKDIEPKPAGNRQKDMDRITLALAINQGGTQ